MVMKRFVKITSIFVVVFLFLLLSKGEVSAEGNITGVNIGDRLGLFDSAAKLVGSGGWVEILTSPAMCTDLVGELATHPEVNIVLRLYNGGQAFSEEDVVPWIATLGQLLAGTGGRKIYVLPWNEINLEAERQGGSKAGAMAFLNGLVSERDKAGLGSVLGILSPTVSFSDPGTAREWINEMAASGFLGKVDGIALNIYDQDGFLDSSGAITNPTLYRNLISTYYNGTSKPVFFTETGVIDSAAGYIRYTDPLVSRFISGATPRLTGDGGVKMYAVFAYDPTPSDGESAGWNMFGAPQTQSAYTAVRGSGSPDSGLFNSTVFGAWLTTNLGGGKVLCSASCGWASTNSKCRPTGGGIIPAIVDPSSAVCPVDDKPKAPGDYPFPSERPSPAFSSAGPVGGGIQADPSCLNGTNQSCFDKICGSGNSDGCDDVRVETKAWCSQEQCTTNGLGKRCGICVSGSNILITYQGQGCPEAFNQENPCQYVATYGDKLPSLLPGIYTVESLGCYPMQPVEVKQGCTISGKLSCDGSLSLRGDADCKRTGRLPAPAPTPPPKADKDTALRNGTPVQGRWCAAERSTPIRLIEKVGYDPTDEMCLSAWWKGNIQLMPKSVTIPFAQDLGQYLVGIFDREHFEAAKIDQLYDQVVGVPLLQKAKGITPIWNLSGPLNRLMSQLEQDRLKHEFLGWLCEAGGDKTQGRIPKQLNTRYADQTQLGGLIGQAWTIRAPVLGSQLPRSQFIPWCEANLPPPLRGVCGTIANNLVPGSDPIVARPCEIYGGVKWPPVVGLDVGDVYAKKMASQCQTTDGKSIPLCLKKKMYQPNFIEQAVWDRVPLFANEESKGEVDLQLCGAQDADAVKIFTAVPQVFRVSSASAALQKALLPVPISGRTQAALAPIAQDETIPTVKPLAVKMWDEFWTEVRERFGPPLEKFLVEAENRVFQREVGVAAAVLKMLPGSIREPIIASSQSTTTGPSLALGQVLAAASCNVKPTSDCAAQFKCTKCKEAQLGPPDTEVFVGYKECLGTACGFKSYNDDTRGNARFVGTRTFINKCAPTDGDPRTWDQRPGCYKLVCALRARDGSCLDYEKVPVRQEDDYDRYVGVNNKVPFLISIWNQSAAGPDGIFNILRGYRNPTKAAGPGYFQPSGKPFSNDNTFLDTVGASSAQYKTTDNFPDMSDGKYINAPGGVVMVKEAWRLLYSKLAGVWNAKNWVVQSVAP